MRNGRILEMFEERSMSRRSQQPNDKGRRFAILENSSHFQKNGKADSDRGVVRRLSGNDGTARARTGPTITANSALLAFAITANAIQNGNNLIKSVDAIGMRITPSAAKVFTCGFVEHASSESMLTWIGVLFRRTSIPDDKSLTTPHQNQGTPTPT